VSRTLIVIYAEMFLLQRQSVIVWGLNFWFWIGCCFFQEDEPNGDRHWIDLSPPLQVGIWCQLYLTYYLLVFIYLGSLFINRCAQWSSSG